jgi:hypothetical protein
MPRTPTIKDAVRRELYIPKEIDQAYERYARRQSISKSLAFRQGLVNGLAVLAGDAPPGSGGKRASHRR